MSSLPLACDDVNYSPRTSAATCKLVPLEDTRLNLSSSSPSSARHVKSFFTADPAGRCCRSLACSPASSSTEQRLGSAWPTYLCQSLSTCAAHAHAPRRDRHALLLRELGLEGRSSRARSSFERVRGGELADRELADRELASGVFGFLHLLCEDGAELFAGGGRPVGVAHEQVADIVGADVEEVTGPHEEDDRLEQVARIRPQQPKRLPLGDAHRRHVDEIEQDACVLGRLLELFEV
eukprot:762638-Hanusia_phi.AAC.3